MTARTKNWVLGVVGTVSGSILCFLLVMCCPAPSRAATICPEFEQGPELDRLISVCDVLKLKWPDWTTKDCARYFIIVGGRDVFESLVRKNAAVTERKTIKDSLAEFDVDLPLLPVSAPMVGTGLPTATPTATP